MPTGHRAERARVVLAEDEPLLREQLRTRLAAAWPEAAIVAEAENGGEALAMCAALEPDVVFLDIRMPVRSGLDVARALAARSHIVFVTAYDEYAVAAFEQGAVDYVLKPVTAERMEKVVARLKQRLDSPPHDLATVLRQLGDQHRSGPLRWIKASLGATMHLIAVDDVCYFQAEDKYTKVVTAQGDALIKKTIKDLYDELDPELFWQVHRSTIVNVRAIARVERDYRDQPLILLKDRREQLPVSRTFAHLFKTM